MLINQSMSIFQCVVCAVFIAVVAADVHAVETFEPKVATLTTLTTIETSNAMTDCTELSRASWQGTSFGTVADTCCDGWGSTQTFNGAAIWSCLPEINDDGGTSLGCEQGYGYTYVGDCGNNLPAQICCTSTPQAYCIDGTTLQFRCAVSGSTSSGSNDDEYLGMAYGFGAFAGVLLLITLALIYKLMTKPEKPPLSSLDLGN